jgi:acylphosphatase
MGFSHWSDAAYEARQNQRQTTNQTAFTYDQQVRASGNVAVHPLMDPMRVTRESRDSADHPQSVAIGVLFDVTGSMGIVPRVLQTKLGALMRVLIQKGYVEHPQILWGGVGDAYTDSVPLQMGQFESGLEMDDELGKIYLEGGGGGQVHETYELALYFMARHTVIDCYEQRGKKGYLFTIGDEMPYDVVRAQHVRAYMGDELRHDIRVEQIVDEVTQRYEYFHIIPTDTSHGRNAEVRKRWKALLGERVLLLDDAGSVCETIALAIGLAEGTIDNLDDGTADLVLAGHDRNAVKAAMTALAPYAAKQTPVTRFVAGFLPRSKRAGRDGRL